MPAQGHRGRSRELTDSDRAEWNHYTRHCCALAHPPAARTVPASGAAHIVRRLRTDGIVVHSRLDLHGQTAVRAHAAVLAFVYQAHKVGLRQIEIITGVGGGETGGVLRRELPFWLDDPQLRPLIVKISHPHAANSGAVRVMLRRAGGSLRR